MPLLDWQMRGALIAARGESMAERSVFISSCSKRELARRRPTPNAYRMQLLLAVLVLWVAVAAFVGVRLGF